MSAENAMNNNSKESSKPLYRAKQSLFYGDANRAMRAAMWADGARCKDGMWVFPSAEIMAKYASAQEPKAAPAQEPKAPKAASAQEPKAPKALKEAMKQAQSIGSSRRRRLELEPSCFFLVSSHMEDKVYGKCFSVRQLDRSSEKVSVRGSDALQIRSTTEKTIVNPEEYKKASDLRSRMRGTLAAEGTTIAPSVIALPLSQRSAFLASAEEVNTRCLAFNRGSSHYMVSVYATEFAVVTSSEAQIAARATWEIRALVDAMTVAIAACDVAAIERAAAGAKARSAALSAGTAQGALNAAIDEARRARSKIAAAAKKGEDITKVRESLSTRAIDSARLVFLEYEIPTEFDLAPATNGQLAAIEIGT